MPETSVASFSLTGKLAIVTGGASGIGTGIATMLAEAGATVVIADRDLPAAEREAGILTEAGYRAAAVHIDMADETSIINSCAEIVTKHGAPWILVNNAGVQDRELLLEGTAKEWDRTVAINARGPYLLTREVARAMVKAGEGGRIVNIATAGLEGSIIKGLTAYVASKGAILGLSRASAFELAEHKITVNTVFPGGVLTPGSLASKGPLAEGPALRPPPYGWCEPADIAAAVYFFVTPAARRVTNQEIAVDAGFSLT